MENKIANSKKAYAGLLYTCALLIFLVGIKFGLIGGVIGGVIAYFIGKQAKKINPKAGEKISGNVKYGGWIALGALVVVILLVLYFSY